jgi:hypothetical protein
MTNLNLWQCSKHKPQREKLGLKTHRLNETEDCPFCVIDSLNEQIKYLKEDIAHLTMNPRLI